MGGASLTYARRYALFAMVGIAGDDDSDAGNVEASSSSPEGSPSTFAAMTGEAISSAESPSNSRLQSERHSPRWTKRKTSQASKQGQSLESFREGLSLAADCEKLLTRAIDVLPARNGLALEERLALDAAFLAQAKQLGAPPELLLAFQAPITTPCENSAFSTPVHKEHADAQAAI
jgi:hypothetical protein